MTFLKKLTLQAIINGGLLAIILFLPISLMIGVYPINDPVHPLIDARFSMADFVIGGVFLLWLVKVIIYREYRAMRLPPVPIIVFIIACFLSGLNAASWKNWLKELIQYLEYFIILFILLVNNMTTQKQIKKMVYLLFGVTGFLVLFALYQHFVLQGNPYLIRASFENQMMLGLYLSPTLPFMLGYALYTEQKLLKILLYLMVFISLSVILTIGVFIALVISFGVMSYLKSKKVLLVFIVVIISIACLYPFIMPSRNNQALKSSMNIYEEGNINYNYYRLQTILYRLKRSTILDKWSHGKHFLITSDLFMSSVIPPVKEDERYVDRIGQKHIKQRYLEWQAALNMMQVQPFLGVGLGNYQNTIGTYYQDLPKINTAEPHQDNGYLIIGSTAGFLGLVSLVWIFVFCLKNSYHAWRVSTNSFDKAMALGLMGSFMGYAITNIFSSILVSGILGYFIIFIFWVNNIYSREFANIRCTS